MLICGENLTDVQLVGRARDEPPNFTTASLVNVRFWHLADIEARKDTALDFNLETCIALWGRPAASHRRPY